MCFKVGSHNSLTFEFKPSDVDPCSQQKSAFLRIQSVLSTIAPCHTLILPLNLNSIPFSYRFHYCSRDSRLVWNLVVTGSRSWRDH